MTDFRCIMVRKILRNRKILIVNDIALNLMDALEALGARVSIASNIVDALTIVRSPARFAGAVVDIRLIDDDAWPVVDELTAAKVPLVVYSGLALPENFHLGFAKIKVVHKTAPASAVAGILVNAISNLRTSERS